MPTLTKVSVLGKGGSGKSTVAALLARVVSGRGAMVLTIDLDVSPGLALALDLPAIDLPLPDSAIEQVPDAPYGWALARHLTAAEAVRRYGVAVSDRIVFFGFGNVTTPSDTLSRYLTAARQVADGFDEPGWVVVADLPAGPTAAFEGCSSFASIALVTVECTTTSILTAHRLVAILDHQGTPNAIVGTKVDGPDDLAVLRREFDLLASIPYDPEIGSLGRTGSAFWATEGSLALSGARSLAMGLGL